MLIHSAASLPLCTESLAETLREVADYARRHLVSTGQSQISIRLAETGARIHQVLASLLPSDTQEFYSERARVGAPMTAAQFLDALPRTKPKHVHSLITLPAGVVDIRRLFDALADVVSPSGRGVMILLVLRGWRFGAEVVDADVDLTFSRFRHGKRALSASLGLRFHALSLKDPVVKATIAVASERAGVPFGKPMAAFAANVPFGAPAASLSDTRLEPPPPEAQRVVLQTFEEALARSAVQVGARTEDLHQFPLLFSRGGGFDKRMTDVMAGRKESVNLPARLRRFMREQFPNYAADAADPEQVWFRRSAAPTLDLLLMFDKVHQWGLGKTFSIDFGVDFPNTPFGGMHTGMGGTRRNLFWLFHEGWEKQVWAYTTSAELDTALASCGNLLRRVLPALEQHSLELLLPPPSMLPKGIEQRGPLSAREAYNVALPLARAWSPDVELESIASVNFLNLGYPIGSVESSLSDDGRLGLSGSWGLKYLSRRLERYCYYTVPHTGRIWWGFYPVLQGAIPKYSSVLADDDWLDSTEIAPRAFAGVREQLGPSRIGQLWLALRDPRRYSGDFVWEATCTSFAETWSGRRDITVQLDRRTGEVLASRER